jgi:hypothetical protein
VADSVRTRVAFGGVLLITVHKLHM